MSGLLKNLLIAFGIAVLLWVGYMVFIQRDDQLVTSSDPASSQAALESQEFLRLLQLLESVRVDGAIFSDQRFRSLIDLRQEIPGEPVGRENPFAPLE